MEAGKEGAVELAAERCEMGTRGGEMGLLHTCAYAISRLRMRNASLPFIPYSGILLRCIFCICIYLFHYSTIPSFHYTIPHHSTIPLSPLSLGKRIWEALSAWTIKTLDTKSLVGYINC